MTPPSLKRVSAALSGLGTALLVFAAVPATLVALAGLPVPRPFTRAAVVSAHGLYDLFALLAWVAWALCCWPLLRSVLVRVRHRDTVVATGSRLSERLAARIAAAVLALAPVLAMTSSAPAFGRTPAPAMSSVVSATTSPGHPSVHLGTSGVPQSDNRSSTTGLEQYSVQPGDTLWSIAQDFYGDGDDWESIARLNLGRVMNDGRRLLDPNLIYPGWSLVFPTPAVAQPPSTAPTAATGATSTTASTVVLPPVRHTVDRVSAHREQRPPARRTSGTPAAVPLPELVLLGLGVIGAAAVSRRVRRLRRSAEDARLDGVASHTMSNEAIDAETLLRRFDGAPVLDWFESANRHLAWAVSDFTGPVPRVRLWRVGPDGVDAWLSEPTDRSPQGWVRTGKGWVWHLPAKTDLRAQGRALAAPMNPVALPVGEDSRGSWLVALEPGGCLPVMGARAVQLVRSMRLTQESWSWAEAVVVTDDVASASRSGAGRVVFIGDPSRLDAQTRARATIVTTQPVPASDLTVTVDDHGASLHPLGITLRAHLQDAEQSGAITDLLVGAATPPEPYDSRGHERAAGSAELDLVIDDLVPGPVEVRLLTPVPRLEGLREELPVKRARRATELVAYLALHHPEAVTGDRLRTRVLGSADADAAAKTLFNTAGAARRSMGVDQQGQALFPAASKTRQYRLSAQVSIDVVRAANLVEAARDAPDPDEAMALYRAALELVEGEPLGGVLAGYGWWEAEGHAGRMVAVLVDAACDLARLASESGHADLASWALLQGRFVDPYSEALTRASMRVAAAAGDVDRLRREWVECQRRVDELDPGAVPSERTEALYATLSKKVPVAAG